MTDESAFWRGLAANPDDEALRLAFADWLEERGDPRSAWIRNPAIVRAMEQPWADPTANLVKRLGEPYRREQVTAGLVLMGGRAVPLLVPALADAIRRDDYQVRDQVHQVLQQIGPAALGYLPELRQQLAAEDAAVRRAAIEALRFLGAEAAPALPLLGDRLREEDGQIVHEAVQTIGAIGPPAGPAVPELEAAYDRTYTISLAWWNDEHIRRDIIKALGNVGDAALAAVPTLMRSFIMGPDEGEEAARILIALGPAAAGPVLTNVRWIDREEEHHAASVLAAVAPDELLFAALDDKGMDHGQLRVVVQALGQRAAQGRERPQEEIARRLVRIVREEQNELQHEAMNWLRQIGRVARVAIPDLREMLPNTSGRLRGELLSVLEALGESGDALADLEARLRSPDAEERVQAVGHLWTLRAPQADEVRLHQTVALLVPLFDDPVAAVRGAAVRAVANLAKADTPGAVTALCAALKDASADVRSAASAGLGRTGQRAAWHVAVLRDELFAAAEPAVPHLLALLRDADPGVRATAVQALNKWPDRADIVAGLRSLLGNRELVDPDVLAALAERRTLPGDLLPEVLALARARDPAVRSGGVRLLSRVESTASQAAAVLCQALRDRLHTEEVVEGLKRYGPAAAEALPDLVALLRGQEVWSEPVVAVLGSLGPAVVPAMRELLRSGQSPLMYYGAQVLHMLGEAAAEAMPELLDILLNDTEYNARQMAGAALCQMGPVPADVLPRLTALMEEREPLWRGYAAYVLARMGSAAQPALPVLERLLEDGDATVRHAAIQALARLAGELPEALPPLRRPFQDASPERRKEALEALQQLAPAVLVRPDIDPLIRPHLGDPAPAVRSAAWACVGAVARSLAAVGRKTGAGPSFNDLFTILRRNLHDPDPEMRNTAAYQIGQLGEAAADAVPELTELPGDPESNCSAVMALGNIGRPASSALPLLRMLARDVQNYLGQRAGTAVERIEGKTG